MREYGLLVTFYDCANMHNMVHLSQTMALLTWQSTGLLDLIIRCGDDVMYLHRKSFLAGPEQKMSSPADEYAEIFGKGEKHVKVLLSLSLNEIKEIFACSEACAKLAKAMAEEEERERERMRKEEAEERRRKEEAEERRRKEEVEERRLKDKRDHELKLAQLKAGTFCHSNYFQSNEFGDHIPVDIAAASNKPNIERFRLVLKKRGLNVDQKVMSRILTHFSSRLIAITSQDGTDEDCYDLYLAAKNLPGPTTKGHIRSALGISVNGPISMASSNILSAINSSGVPLVVKLLRYGQLPFSCPETERSQAIDAEIAACRLIAFHKLDGLVHYNHQIVSTTDSGGLEVGIGDWKALIAPRFVESVDAAPQLDEAVLQSGYFRIKEALTQLHEQAQLVHMDVKASNVFIDSAGLWFLGDHGSCRRAMSPIFSATLELNPYKLTFNKTLAHASMDFVQLCVMIAMLLDINSLSNLLDDDSVKACASKVRGKLESILKEEFRQQILQDYDKNLKLVQDHLATVEG